MTNLEKEDSNRWQMHTCFMQRAHNSSHFNQTQSQKKNSQKGRTFQSSQLPWW
jgi:hypothetical protein